MEVPLPPNLQTELADIANRTGRTPEQFAAEILAAGLESERRYFRAVEQGIASADAGRFIEDEQVREWIERLEASNPD
jgi:predicted transcriptional regulator